VGASLHSGKKIKQHKMLLVQTLEALVVMPNLLVRELFPLRKKKIIIIGKEKQKNMKF
jgi:hypothetical protein